MAQPLTAQQIQVLLAGGNPFLGNAMGGAMSIPGTPGGKSSGGAVPAFVPPAAPQMRIPATPGGKASL
jgi:hypothetical protein